MNELESFLKNNFKGNKRRKLGGLISPIKHGRAIPKGTLVIMASGDTQLRLRILEKDTPHRGFSTPLIINDEGQSLRISPNYLHWYLSHDEIKEKLMNHATGSVLLRIPKKIIENIPIPLPTNTSRRKANKEVIIRKKDDGFKNLIDEFYRDYLLNLKNRRYKTALILAGAMSEAFVYQLLLDEGVDKKLLDKDRSLGIGRLITYVKLLKLDKSFDLPLNHFAAIQKKRNKAIHVGSYRTKPVTFGQSDLVSFNYIIKYFGIGI